MTDPATFRRVMGFWATGVSVVTASGADGPYGATLNAVSSLSLSPSLLLVCFDLEARTLGAIRDSGRFCVNMLSAEQEEISRRFVGKRSMSDKFVELAWTTKHGTPVLDNCLATVVCDVAQEIEAGDHAIVIGEPVDMELRDDLHPLVFYRGAYWERIAERAESGVLPTGEFRMSQPAAGGDADDDAGARPAQP